MKRQLRLDRIVKTFVAAAMFATVTAGAGCQSLSDALGGLDRPSARIANASVGDLSLDGATLLFEVDVSNPYGVPLPLASMKYGLASGGRQVLDGGSELSGVVPAYGSRTIALPVALRFDDLLAALSGVRPGSLIPYEADVELSVDAPGVGPLALPLSKKGELPIPAVPDVKLVGVDWDELSLSRAAGTVNMQLTNTNEFEFNLSGLSTNLALGGQQVAKTGLAQPMRFAAGQAQEIAIPISFSPSSLGFGLFRALTGDSAAYELNGEMELQTPFGPLRTPFSTSGKTPLR